MKVTKKLLSILLAVTMVFGVMCVAAFAEDEAARYITGTIDISISTPIAGNQSYGDTLPDSGKVYVPQFTWYDSDGNEFNSSYVGGETYTAVLTVVPVDGYLFDEEITITVNGEATEVISAAEDSLVVKVSFTCDEGADNSSVFTTILSILRSALKVVWDFILHFIGY